ncbi:MAG: hypothetical protein ACMUJM_06155 [bacterium]
MKKRWVILLLAIGIVMATTPILAQYNAAITTNIAIDYTNVNKHEMRLKGSFFAIADWQVDIAVRADSGSTYYITYKNGYGNAVINGQSITEYLNGNFFSTSQQQWSDIAAPKTINQSLILASDSFSDVAAELIGMRVSGNAVAVAAIGIVDDQDPPQGYIEDFTYTNFAASGWQVENTTTGTAQIDTTYASDGFYSVRIQSTQGGTGNIPNNYYTDPTTGQTYYRDPTTGQSYYINPTTGQPTSPVTGTSTSQGTYYRDPTTGQTYYRDPTTGQTYYINPTTGQPTSPTTGYPQGYQYAQPYAQPYGQPYAQPYGQPYAQPYGQPYAQPYGQPYAQPYGQYGQPYGQQVSYSPGGSVYAYVPLYQQQGGTASPYNWSGTGQSGTTWYTGQLGGQQGQGYYGQTTNAQTPMVSPYAGPYGYSGSGAYSGGLYSSPYAAPFGAAPFAAAPFGAAPLGGLGSLGGFGFPSLGSGLGLGLPAASLSGLPGFSSFDPLGLAFFGGLF